MKRLLPVLVVYGVLLGNAGLSLGENLETCLSGNYPTLCKKLLLTPDQRRQADAAERRENLHTCLSGIPPQLRETFC